MRLPCGGSALSGIAWRPEFRPPIGRRDAAVPRLTSEQGDSRSGGPTPDSLVRGGGGGRPQRSHTRELLTPVGSSMSERRRFRDRSQRPAGGNQAQGQPRPHQQQRGPNRGGGGNFNGNANGNVAGNGNGNGHAAGQGYPRPQRQNNGYRGGGGGGGGGGRQEPPAAPAVAGAVVEGLLQMHEERGDGVLRDPLHPLRPAVGNVIVPRNTIRELNLRPGLLVAGVPNGRTLTRIDTIEGNPVDDYRSKQALYDMTALDPCPVLKLEHDPAEMTTPRDRHPHARRLRPAGADRRPAPHGQDDPAPEHGPGDRRQLPRRQADPPAGRRAARGSDRHAPQRSRARSYASSNDNTRSRSTWSWPR